MFFGQLSIPCLIIDLPGDHTAGSVRWPLTTCQRKWMVCPHPAKSPRFSRWWSWLWGDSQWDLNCRLAAAGLLAPAESRYISRVFTDLCRRGDPERPANIAAVTAGLVSGDKCRQSMHSSVSNYQHHHRLSFQQSALTPTGTTQTGGGGKPRVE